MECPWKFPGLLHTASPISVPESIRSFSLPALISNKYQALAMNKPEGEITGILVHLLESCRRKRTTCRSLQH